MGKIFCPNKQSLTKLNFSNTIPASYTFQTWNSNTTKSIAKQNANSPPKKTENGKQKGQKKGEDELTVGNPEVRFMKTEIHFQVSMTKANACNPYRERS